MLHLLGRQVPVKALSFSFYCDFMTLIWVEFCIDGIDINLANPKDIRSTIAMVPQDCVIFGDSVTENIRFSYPHATDTQVIEAAKAASARFYLSASRRV